MSAPPTRPPSPPAWTLGELRGLIPAGGPRGALDGLDVELHRPGGPWMEQVEAHLSALARLPRHLSRALLRLLEDLRAPDPVLQEARRRLQTA